MEKPKIRFKGYQEDWEQRKYAEVIELLSGQDFNPEEYNEDGIGIPYLTGASCIENGCTTAVRWTEKPRCVAEKGDTVLVCKGSGYGTIATVNQEKAHIARQFMALKVKKHELDNRFNYFLLNSVVENIKTDARGLIAGIARDAVLKQEIVIPCLNEQTKIGEYFDSLDHLITLHQRKCEETKILKKYMLQKMFPQNGHSVPEIRFSGFTEDWEQRKLGHLIEDNIIMEQSDGNHGELYPRSDEFTDAGIPYIAASAISSSGDDIDFNLVKYLPLKRAEQFRKGVAQNGDILLAHNATVGPCLQLSMEYNFAILSTSLTLFRINENKMNSKFFLQMLRSDLFQNQLFKYMKQTTRSQVPILTQRKLEVCYPSNRQEQELIGTYLSNLDRLITLHQQKCNELRNIKKFMLQNMFI